jgi:hypothetical protein
MTTSTVLGLVGGLLLLVALIGGGFSFSGTMMPTVSRAVRIPCFIIGCILVFSAIVLALREHPDPVSDGGGSPQTAPGAPATFVGVVQFAGGEFAYVYQLPSLSAPRIGALMNGTNVTILCTTQGSAVLRSDGMISSLWDRIDQGYIPDVNVYTGTDQPTVRNC